MAKVISIRVLDPAEGANLADFEAFMQELVANTLVADGWKAYFVKGDRGERNGKYAFIHEFDSIETRDRYFPVADSDEPPEETQQLMSSFGPDDIGERWGALVAPNDAYTDYIVPD